MSITSDNSVLISFVAVIVAVLAAVASFWSAYSSHRSRRAAERSLRLTEERHEEELTPRFVAWLELVKGETIMRLKNSGIVSYKSVVFTLEPADGLVGLPIIGLQMGGWGGRQDTGDFGIFEAGATKVLLADWRQSHPSKNFRLRLVCTDFEERKWTTTTTGETVYRSRS